MEKSNPMVILRASYHDLVACVLSIPEAAFLSPMNGWSPRDVVAHLIGWNRFMIQACKSILAGEAPSYYADAPNDYRNINAALVQHYSSQLRGELLRELDSSKKEFEAHVGSVPSSELGANHNVTHYSGEPATVLKIIRSLAGDYEHHIAQIEAWLATQ